MKDSKALIAVFISGGGSNLNALIEASRAGILDGQITYVVSNRKKAYGLTIAAEAGIETFVYRKKNYSSPSEAADDLSARLRERKIDYIALAGYLSLLPNMVVAEYADHIVNIHPALLPKYGGQGMYGHYVHEAVLAAGDTESGATVHLVDERYDEGRILKQVIVPVEPDDTPDDLAGRILAQEHKLYARVLNKLIKGEYDKNHG